MEINEENDGCVH